MSDLVPVRFRDCSCPGTPHADEGDIAYLRPRLSYEGGAEAMVKLQEMDPSTSDAQFSVALSPIFIRHGVVDWNVVDEDGDPVPVAHDFDWAEGFPIVEKLGAEGLDYGGQVLAPLVLKTSQSSKPGRTANSTRAASASRKPRSHSEPSSSPS